MNCKELERDIALYAGGDLEQTAAIEAHMATCPKCRELASDLRELRGELAELREVALPTLSVRRPRPVRLRPWAVAGAIAAAVLIVLLIPKRADVAPPPRVAWVPPAPVVEMKPLAHARGSVARHIVPKQPEPNTEFVKLMTDDENVVILWAMNTKGDYR